MAIHFNYIKGLNGNVTNLTTDSIYTYIKWSQGPARNAEGNISLDCGYLPTIIASTTNALDSTSNGTTQCDLGHIITSNATGQTFNQSMYYNKYIFLKGHTDTAFKIGLINAVNETSDDPYLTTVTLINNQPKYGCSVDLKGLQLFYNYDNNGSGETTKELLIVKVPTFENHAFTKFEGHGQNTKDSNYSQYSDYNAWFTKSIKVDEHIDALFFNATSDKRAKENIQPATYNAIELIKELPVYTYNYKNKVETVTGILAQDLLAAQPEGLDLVSNINATGENGDYMSIKNDKLVFILMKAVQEQQEQIEKLQEELNKLKESQ